MERTDGKGGAGKREKKARRGMVGTINITTTTSFLTCLSSVPKLYGSVILNTEVPWFFNCPLVVHAIMLNYYLNIRFIWECMVFKVLLHICVEFIWFNTIKFIVLIIMHTSPNIVLHMNIEKIILISNILLNASLKQSRVYACVWYLVLGCGTHPVPLSVAE